MMAAGPISQQDDKERQEQEIDQSEEAREHLPEVRLHRRTFVTAGGKQKISEDQKERREQQPVLGSGREEIGKAQKPRQTQNEPALLRAIWKVQDHPAKLVKHGQRNSQRQHGRTYSSHDGQEQQDR